MDRTTARARGGAAVVLGVDSERAASASERIEHGLARTAESPPLSLKRTEVLEPTLQALVASIDDLRACMRRFGEIPPPRSGVLGTVEAAIKSVVRRLIQRHLDQEKEVHAALDTVLVRLRDVIRAEHELLDANATVLTDASVRRARAGDAD